MRWLLHGCADACTDTGTLCLSHSPTYWLPDSPPDARTDSLTDATADGDPDRLTDAPPARRHLLTHRLADASPAHSAPTRCHLLSYRLADTGGHSR